MDGTVYPSIKCIQNSDIGFDITKTVLQFQGDDLTRTQCEVYPWKIREKYVVYTIYNLYKRYDKYIEL